MMAETMTNQAQPEGEPEGGAKILTAEEITNLINDGVKAAFETRDKQKSAAEAKKKKLEGLTGDERANARIAELEKELEERDAAISLKENKITAMPELEKRGIPTAFVDFIVTSDTDETMKNIKLFEKELNALKSAAAKSQLHSTTPGGGYIGGTGGGHVTPEQFKKMGLREKQELKNTNPELFGELTKR